MARMLKTMDMKSALRNLTLRILHSLALGVVVTAANPLTTPTTSPTESHLVNVTTSTLLPWRSPKHMLDHIRWAGGGSTNLSRVTFTDGNRSNSAAKHLSSISSLGAAAGNTMPAEESYTVPGCQRLDPVSFCDPHHMLEEKQAASVRSALESICVETECPCSECVASCHGYAVSVVLLHSVPFLRDVPLANHSSLWQQALSSWASELRSRSTLGACGEDIVVLFSINNEFQMYTSAGHIAGRRLTQKCADQVYHEHQHMLEAGLVEEAILATLASYRSLLSPSTVGWPCSRPEYVVMTTGVKIAIIYGTVCLPLIGCVIFIFLGPCFRGRGFGGRTDKTMFHSTYRRRQQVDLDDDCGGVGVSCGGRHSAGGYSKIRDTRL